MPVQVQPFLKGLGLVMCWREAVVVAVVLLGTMPGAGVPGAGGARARAKVRGHVVEVVVVVLNLKKKLQTMQVVGLRYMLHFLKKVAPVMVQWGLFLILGVALNLLELDMVLCWNYLMVVGMVM